MEKRKFWTEEEELYLIQNYSVLGKACAGHLDKTERAIFAKANKLGLVSKAKKPSRAKTNEEYDLELFEREINFLRLEDYIDNKTPILHECIEGHTWRISPTHILSSKSGCPHCAGNAKRTSEEYNSLSPFKVLETYVNKETPILHECSEGHQWKARPGHILNSKSGCPVCNTNSFKYNEPAILYYLKITEDNLIYYKLGITNRTIRKRFNGDLATKDIEVIETWYFETGQEAWDTEQELLKKYKQDRQNIKNFLKSGGNTELFEYDILGLDNGSNKNVYDLL